MARALSTSRVSRHLLLGYTLFIVYGCTIPFRFTTDRAALADRWAHVNWNPLLTDGGRRRFHIPDAVQNVILFLPYGIIASFALSPRVPSFGRRVAAVGAAAAVLSAAVEGIQLFTVDRDVTTTDVVTDTIGALAGVVGAHLLRPLGARSVRRLARAGAVNSRAFYAFAVAAAVVLVAAWQPFDVTLDVSTFLDKLRALRQDVWQYGVATDEGMAVVHAALLAMAASAWLAAVGIERPSAVTIPVGLVLAIGLEASQLFIASRWPGLLDAVVTGVGFVIGSLLWRGRNYLPPLAWLAMLIVASEAAAAIQMLSPFVVATVRQPFEWLPLMAYSRLAAFEMVGHVIDVWLVFFPIGFVIGLLRPIRPTLGAAAAVCLAMALPLEYAQGWIVGRAPDVTDLVLAAASGALGVWAAERGGDAFARHLRP